jgi:hypothetical protein
MAFVTPGSSKEGPQEASECIEKDQPASGKKTRSKGTMREPTQQAAAATDQEELKEALQDLEEDKGDWSKGG